MAGDVPQDAPVAKIPRQRTSALDLIRGVPGALASIGSSIPAQIAGRATALFNPAAGQKVAEAMTYQPSERGQEVLDRFGRVLEKSKLEGMGPMALPAGGVAAPVALPQPLQKGARSLMQSALKPSKSEMKSGKGARAVDTMLKEGFNVTEGGVQKMSAEIDRLNEAIKEVIKNSPATVDKAKATKALAEATEKFKMQVTPQADLATIQKALDDFMANPLFEGMEEIPIQLAQDMKQGTYRVLGDKAYGEQKGAGAEAQKALARGLKEGIVEAAPEVGPLNARESALINARNIAANRVATSGNKNPMGLGLLHPQTILPWLVDRSGAAKSVGARGLYNLGEALPAQANVPSPATLRALKVAPFIGANEEYQ